MTADELWRMPKDDLRHELIRGELTTMTPAGFDHGAISSRFVVRLGAHVLSARLGEVLTAETGFVLSHDPDTVRAPDVAFVRQDRIPSPRPVKFWDGAPDLAVEVISPSDTATDIDDKVQEYLDAGTTEVIVINPKIKSVKVFRRGQNATVLRSGDVLDGLESVPGFRCTVDEVFS